MKPHRLEDIHGNDLLIIPVVDDPGGHRLLLSTLPQTSALLNIQQAAELRNTISKWLDVARRAQ